MVEKVGYANGLKFDAARFLAKDEAPAFLRKMEIAKRNYTWHLRIGRFVFYSSLFAISIAFLVSLLSIYDISETWIVPFLFCILLTAIAGVLQEMIFGFRIWIRAIFTIPLIYVLLGLVFPSLLVNEGTMSAILIIFVFAGWIMILLRWFDARRSLPLVSAGLEDFHEGKVYSFLDYDDEGNEFRLEVFPNSKLIYKFQDKTITKWEAADVKEVALEKPDEFLAPWYYAPEEDSETGMQFYQRAMSSSELEELVEIRKNFLRKSWISVLPGIYLSAIGVRFIENLMNWNIEPELSTNGWFAAIMLGMLIPVKSILRWKSLSNDLNTRTIVSAWSKESEDHHSELIEEFLQESNLLWSLNNRPSDLRLVSQV